MDKKALRFTSFKALRMPGFSDGLKPEGGFADAVTIVAGPNASGKSSMARCMNAMIWQHKLTGIIAEAGAEIGETRIHFEGEGSIYKIRGIDTKELESALPEPQFAKNYYLALDNLMEGLEANILHTFLTELNGGLHLGDLREMLGADRIESSPILKEVKDLNEALNHQRDVVKGQQDLLSRERELSVLQDELDKARAADKKVALLIVLIELHEAREKEEEAKRFLDSMDGRLDKLNDNDAEILESFLLELERATSGRQAEERDIDRLKKAIATLGLPADGIRTDELTRLASELKKAEELDKDILATSAQADEQRASALAFWKKADPQADEARLSELPVDWAGKNEEFYLASLEERIRLNQLEQDIVKQRGIVNKYLDIKAAEQYRNGLALLQKWLSVHDEVEAPVKRKSAVLPTLILTVVGMVVLSLSHYLEIPYVYGVLAIILMFVLVNFQSFRRFVVPETEVEKLGEERVRIRDEFEQLSLLSAPMAWTNDGVQQMLNALYPLIYKAREKDFAIENLEGLEARLERQQKVLVGFNNRRKELRVELASVISVPENIRASDLHNYVDLMQQCLKALGLAAGYRAKCETLQTQLDGCKELLAAFLVVSGLEADVSMAVSELAGKFEVVKEKSNQYNALQDQVQKATFRLEECRRNEEQYTRQIADQNVKLGLEPENKSLSAAHDRMVQLASFREAKDAYNDARKKVQYLLAKEIVSASDDNDAYSAFDREALHDERERAKIAADRREELVRQVSTLENSLEKVKESHDLEAALSRTRTAYDTLEARFEDNLLRVTAGAVLDTLKKHRKADERSTLFKRANKYFTRFTHGAYSLDVQGDGSEHFTARDSRQGVEMSLAELSTGTRIQLRLAARIAVIEEREGDLKLPIFADELLANSDDHRANAIIEALIEIGKSGRQVFYLTAQGDEVAKWRNALEGQKLDYSLVSLPTDGRPQVDIDRELNTDIQSHPKPEGFSREQYAKEIGVPEFNILRHDTGDLHLWYLIDDLEQLYQCLNRQLHTWGRLKNFYESGGQLQRYSDTFHQRLKEVTAVLKKAAELLQHGRSQTIGMEDIEASGAVSDKFIEDVNALLGEVEFNPERLIEELRNGSVSGFYKSKTEELSHYLKEKGLLTDKEPFSRDEFFTQLAREKGHVKHFSEAMELLQKLMPTDPFGTEK